MNSQLSATPGVTEREILIGSHQPLSGPAAQFSVISKSTEVYFRYINDQGGIHGRRLQYLYLDDGFLPEQTQEVVRRLVLQESIFLLLNGMGTRPHASVSDWLQLLEIPDFFVGSRDTRWVEPLKETVFGFYPTPRIEGRILAKHLLKASRGGRIVVWYRNDPTMKQTSKFFSESLMQGHFQWEQSQVPIGVFNLFSTHRQLKRQDLFQVEQVSHPVTGLDLRASIEQIKELNPRILVLFTTPQPALELLRQLYRSGFSGRIYLGLNLADSRLLQSAGPHAMEGVSMLTAHPLSSQREDPGIQLHYALLKEYAPEIEMSRWTIYGHAVAELMVEILSRSGSGLTRKQVIETAEQLDQWQGLLNPPITLNARNHLPITRLRVVQVKSGKFEIISDWINGQ